MGISSLDDLKLKVGEVSQVAVVVKNLQKAMEKYWRILGIGPWYIYTFAPPALREPMIRGKPINYSMKLAIALIGSMQLELIEPLEGPSIYKEFLAEKGEGLHHIQSQTENMNDVLKTFKEIGITVLMSGKIGTAEFYYMDTEPMLGIIYEVVSGAGALPFEATYPPSGPT
jgi:4-hydroxyphenylpyruvate dioxygenase-like putative hemolysin